ncbi:IS3 family transposase [Providencia rettgeri]|uniref:IS3 family transposase n=1 Tax=Providencia TaxID=586 RepID=UPI00300E4D2B
MRHVYRVMDTTYSTRRMVAELYELGFKVGRYKIRKLMKSLQLVAKHLKQHRYSMSGKSSGIAPNRLNRPFLIA